METFLKGLDPEIETRLPNGNEEETDDDEDDEYAEKCDLTTIVGERLHGPVFDDEHEECSRKVGYASPKSLIIQT